MKGRTVCIVYILSHWMTAKRECANVPGTGGTKSLGGHRHRSVREQRVSGFDQINFVVGHKLIESQF